MGHLHVVDLTSDEMSHIVPLRRRDPAFNSSVAQLIETAVTAPSAYLLTYICLPSGLIAMRLGPEPPEFPHP